MSILNAGFPVGAAECKKKQLERQITLQYNTKHEHHIQFTTEQCISLRSIIYKKREKNDKTQNNNNEI